MSAIKRQFKRIPLWITVDYAAILHMPSAMRDWLLDSASLTLRIKAYCQANQLGCFSVRLLSQGMGIPSNDEMQRLKLKSRRYALIREVALYCGDTPLIYARTVIPVTTLTGTQRRLGHLGNRPLGEFLFAQPELHRDVMEIAVVKAGHQLFDSALSCIIQTPEQIWARRSVFRLGQKPLLVAEVFLPEVLSKSHHHGFIPPVHPVLTASFSSTGRTGGDA